MALPFYVKLERPDGTVGGLAEHSFRTLEWIGGVRIPRSYVKTGQWTEGDFGSADWYVEQARDRGEQVNTRRLWDLLEKEPWQRTEPHHELMILESDVYAPGTFFVFGETRSKVGNDGGVTSDTYTTGNPYTTGVVLSVNRMRQWYGQEWGTAFFALLLHEEGHFFGIPSRESPGFLAYNDPRVKSGLELGHCDERACLMEQVNVDGRLNALEKASLVQRENPDWFCDWDLVALRRNLRKVYGACSGAPAWPARALGKYLTVVKKRAELLEGRITRFEEEEKGGEHAAYAEKTAAGLRGGLSSARQPLSRAPEDLGALDAVDEAVSRLGKEIDNVRLGLELERKGWLGPGV